MNILIACIYLIVALLVLRSLNLGKKLGISNKFILLLFLIKCAVGALLLHAYNGNYEERKKADVYKFYDDGSILLNGILTDGQVQADQMQNWIRQYDHGFNNDNRLMIILNAALNAMTFGNIWAIMILMNLIVVCALCQIVKILALTYWEDRWFLALSVLIPSVLVWHSILLKEPVALVGIALLLTVLDAGLSRSSRLIWALCGLGILLFIKVYLLAVLLPLMLISVVRIAQINWSFNLLKYSAFLTIGTIFLVGFVHTDKGENTVNSLAFKQQDFKNIAEGGIILKNDTSYCHFANNERHMVIYDADSNARIKEGASFNYFKLPNTEDSIYVKAFSGNGDFKLVFENPRSGSIVKVPSFNSGFGSLINVVPYALLNTIIYPLPFTHDNLLVTLAGFENVFIMVMLIVSFIFRKDLINFNLVFATLIFIVSVYLLIGFTTPVLGAIVRYKSIMLPFVWYVCYLLIDLRKIESFKFVKWLKSFVLQEQHQA